MIDVQRIVVDRFGRKDGLFLTIESRYVEVVDVVEFKQLSKVDKREAGVVGCGSCLQLVLCELRLGFKQVDFGYLSRFEQCSLARQLVGRQFNLVQGYFMKLPVVQNLQVGCDYIQRYVVLCGGILLNHSGKIGLGELYLTHGRQSVEHREGERCAPLCIGGVSVGIGVFGGKSSSYAPGLSCACRYVGKQLRFGRCHAQFR